MFYNDKNNLVQIIVIENKLFLNFLEVEKM